MSKRGDTEQFGKFELVTFPGPICRHQRSNKHAHARLPIQATLLGGDSLHGELVPGLIRSVELVLECKQLARTARERRSCEAV
jgi:hypothetical protein